MPYLSSFRIANARKVGVALALICPLLLTSCFEKLEQFLPKPPPKKVEQVEVPLTEEEQKLQDSMENKNAFSTDEIAKAEAVSEEPEFELNKSSIVSILLYHDFVPRIPRNDMMVSVPLFRAQMQALKDANIPVISMADVIAWKKGEKNIPDEAVVITLDDGWIGVYEHAYPILKEFNYPFTLYLYKNYVGTGGRSMTVDQIKEMLANGGELGSHTLSHKPLAGSKRGMTPEKYQEWLTAEIYESKKWLEATFNMPCLTLAYPYGNKNEEVVKMAMEAGYEAAVTVNPQKFTWDTPNGELPRFTQLRDSDTNFRLATSFRGMGTNIAESKFIKNDAVDETGQKLIELNPEPNSSIAERQPLVTAKLSRMGDVLPETITLRVGGFGVVPYQYDASTQTVQYRIPQRLRGDDCTVILSFKRSGQEKEETVTWSFKIDHAASYIPVEVAQEQPATDTTTAK